MPPECQIILGSGENRAKDWATEIHDYRRRLDGCSSKGYSAVMEFEWDEAKSEACFAERGFDFAYVIRAFFDPNRVVRSDARWAYGEDRYQLLGSIEGRVFFVVYTLRANTIRIISARKANQREVHDYENAAR